MTESTGLLVLFFTLVISSVALSLEGVSASQDGMCTFNNTSFTLSVDPQDSSVISFDTGYNNLTYGENITCYWNITANPGYFVKIQFVEFNGCCELYKNCSNHYLEAREGRNESGPLLSKLCTEEDYIHPNQIYSIGTDMFVKWFFKRSPNTTNFTLSFEANVTAVHHVSSCSLDNHNDANKNIIINGSQGMFFSPYSSEYGGYPPRSECTWKISAPPGYIIKVEFASFVLVGSLDCDNDRVHFFDGVFLIDSDSFLSAYQNSLGKYCGASARTVYSMTSGITVHFFAGSSYFRNDPRDGFVARYQILRQESTGPCTDSRPSNQMSGQGGTLFSPNYPFNAYPKNDCTWVLTPLKGHHLRFSTFLIFFLNPNVSYLEIRRGSTAEGTLIGRYSGANTPMVIYADHSLWVQFVNKQSNKSSLLSGFTASYESIAQIPPVCSPLNNATTNNNLLLSEHRGSFRSPYYPANYPPNKWQCTWKIKGLPGKRIKLTLNDIDVGPSSNVCLSVRDGLSGSSPLLGNYCKAEKNRDVYSQSDSMWIRFHSDSNITSKGFDASYVMNDLCDKFNSRDANNDIRFTGSSGNFTSPNYPKNYPVTISCTWKISVPAGSRVKLTFSSFSVGNESSDCTGSLSGLVLVYNGIGTNDVIGDYCGQDTPGPIFSRDNTMSVTFQSINGRAFTGFKAQFNAAPASSLNLAAIIGGAVGGVVLLAIIGLLVYIFVVRKRKQDYVYDRMY